MSAKAVSSVDRANGCSRPVMVFIGVMFFLVGAILFWVFSIRPLMLAYAAQDWPSAPCVITSSTIESHSDEDGTTYSPEIRYRYSLDGADLNGHRYSFLEYSGSLRRAKRIVAQYPVGLQTECYYDPDDPSESVLEPRVGSSILIGLFPLMFVAIGALVLVYAVFGKFDSLPSRRVRTTIVDDVPDQPPLEDAQRLEGPQKLRPAESRLAKLLVIIGVAIFWDGIVSIFLVEIVQDPHWFECLFITPFVLVGLALLAAVVYQALAFTNPRVEVALSNGAVTLGESIDVAWQLSGAVRRIRELAVTLEGVEKATYTRGTSTYTDTETFLLHSIFTGGQGTELAFGTRTVEIPPDTMHSFRGSKNEIQWVIRVHGQIRTWPDINETFVFVVKPYPPK